MKDEFVSTVSHELRTPLTSIRSFSEILLSEPDLPAEQRREFTEIIVNETHRLSRLINDVLDLAKIDADSIQWDIQDTDLVALLREASTAVSQLYNERKIKLSLKLPSKQVIAKIDRDRIIQVTINLLSNAAKFCEQGTGEVTIELTTKKQSLVVSISDNGCGIEPEFQGVLFNKFQQVDHAQDGRPKGTGLGLAISKGIVEHHKGKIWLESTPNKGSKFYFSLPKW